MRRSCLTSFAFLVHFLPYSSLVGAASSNPQHKHRHRHLHQRDQKAAGSVDVTAAHPTNTSANVPFKQATNGSTPAGWIQLGTPKKWLFVIFDTGSDKLVAKTWETLASELASIDQGVEGMVLPSQFIYDHNASSSYEVQYMTDPDSGKQTPRQSSITYGSGTAITDVGKETVLVGNRPLQNFTLMEITADSLQLLHTSKGIAGVLGLQHMKNKSLGNSLFSRMRDENVLTSFGYCRGTGNNGTFIWGDQSTEGQELNVVGQMHWAVKLGGVNLKASESGSSLVDRHSTASRRINGNGDVDVWPFTDWGGDDSSTGTSDTSSDDALLSVNACPDDSCIGILDTGSNIIAGPSHVMKNITKLIDIKPDCSNFDALPSITMRFGGLPVTIPPSGYVMKVPMPRWTASSMAGDGHLDTDGEGGHGENDGESGTSHDMGIEVQPGALRRHRPMASQDFEAGSAALGERRAVSSDSTSQRRWRALFERLDKQYGVDLKEMVDDMLKIMNDTSPDFMCMPALVPLDKHTEFGPLWVVGTPLLDAYYARWSFAQGADSPKIHLKPLDQAEACKDQGAAQVVHPSPGLIRTQKSPGASRVQSLAAAQSLKRGPIERLPHEISYPHWAKELSRI